MRYTYSRWTDGTGASHICAFDLIGALADDLISGSDVRETLRQVTRDGIGDDESSRMPGVGDLLEQLRVQRRDELARFNFGPIMAELERCVDRIVETEARELDRKLDESMRWDGDSVARDAIGAIVERRRNFLQSLPDGTGPRIARLAEYEFFDDVARRSFQSLLQDLQRNVLDTHFRSMRESLQSIDGHNLQEMKSMLHDLNELLEARANGIDPRMTSFLEEHGRFFPGAERLEDIIAQMLDQSDGTESLMRSMPAEMRQPLENLMRTVMQDRELGEELQHIAESLGSIGPSAPRMPDHPVWSDRSLTLDEALRVMRHMQSLDRLERDLQRALDSGCVDHLDPDHVRRIMGDNASSALAQLQALPAILEEAGFVERREDVLELTARGIRAIGEKAVREIFLHLKRDSFGRHPVPFAGPGGDRSDETKPYEFGDAFLLDMHDTLMNGLRRGGVGPQITLAMEDFQVYGTEYLTRSATVLMLDMSRSMPLRGCFAAAKKVAFALNSLIRAQYPRDHLHIIGFSNVARLVQPEALQRVTWSDGVYGTNMQHGFMLARQVLGREKTGNKQIILITDGEPTAHFEGDTVHFAYPPTARTFGETLREVKRCTREGIVINTFMLDRSHALAEFVNQMTDVNRGRAFFATPEKLGDYILVDYLARKRQTATMRFASGELRSI